MRTYVVTAARLERLAAVHPELFASHGHGRGDTDVTIGRWRTRHGLAWDIRRQDRRPARYDDWRPFVALEPHEGHTRPIGLQSIGLQSSQAAGLQSDPAGSSPLQKQTIIGEQHSATLGSGQNLSMIRPDRPRHDACLSRRQTSIVNNRLSQVGATP